MRSLIRFRANELVIRSKEECRCLSGDTCMIVHFKAWILLDS